MRTGREGIGVLGALGLRSRMADHRKYSVAEMAWNNFGTGQTAFGFHPGDMSAAVDPVLKGISSHYTSPPHGPPRRCFALGWVV